MFRIIPLLPRGVSQPARQKRALDRIEMTLLADALRLGSLSAVFSRLTREDAMPGRSGWRQHRGIRCDRPRSQPGTDSTARRKWHCITRGISPGRKRRVL